MEPADQELLIELLTQQRVASMSVLVEDKPYIGMLPFVMSADFGAALIHASRLARHTAGLVPDAPFGLLVQEPDHWKANPSQLARVSFQGAVHPLNRDGAAYETGRALYLEKFPKSKITFQLGDFRLYELRVETARFVAGFGKTFDLMPAELEQLSQRSFEAEDEPS
jgi:putative heme iron utilization protein